MPRDVRGVALDHSGSICGARLVVGGRSQQVRRRRCRNRDRPCPRRSCSREKTAPLPQDSIWMNSKRTLPSGVSISTDEEAGVRAAGEPCSGAERESSSQQFAPLASEPRGDKLAQRKMTHKHRVSSKKSWLGKLPAKVFSTKTLPQRLKREMHFNRWGALMSNRKPTLQLEPDIWHLQPLNEDCRRVYKIPE